ncbi:MAG: hypothetical protein FJZ43_00005, partial [Candidatus Staskawiczbacteria bacterium]|nr:hypothetical protein [Candidatus Staskawiczbacteria bacterium]
MYSKNSKLISKFTVICLAFVVVVLPLTVPTNASAVTSATSLSYNACPDGSDYDTVVVPSAASAGVV